jgi:hypothetical protein
LTEALAAWRDRSSRNAGFPRCAVDDTITEPWYTSLGNGHFNQALNLFRLEWPSVLSFGSRWVVATTDKALRRAIDVGVSSVVLRAETPRAVRMEISLLLNQTHMLKWDMREDTGEAYALPQQDDGKLSQFERLSKVSDSEMLSDLVRTKFKLGERLPVDTGGYQNLPKESDLPKPIKSKL